jgi:hypothetical protein
VRRDSKVFWQLVAQKYTQAPSYWPLAGARSVSTVIPQTGSFAFGMVNDPERVVDALYAAGRAGHLVAVRLSVAR